MTTTELSARTAYLGSFIQRRSGLTTMGDLEPLPVLVRLASSAGAPATTAASRAPGSADGDR